MTPAARIAAAIELLGAIEAEGGARAADRCVQSFFRARRYAGSKDRADITARIYAVLRRRAELDWWLAREGASLDARTRVIGSLALLDRKPAEEIASVFGQGERTAGALTEAEAVLARRLSDADPATAPDWARGGFPEWLRPELERRFGADLLAAMQAMQERAPVDLRVNPAKGTREQALEALRVLRVPAEPTRLSPIGIRLGERAKIDDKAVHQSGLVEPQDEGSQLVSLLVEAEPRMQVVDLCAGAGGKALAIAAGMGNRGQIYACDTDARRLARLNPRVQRAGVRNIQAVTLADRDDDPFLTATAGKADRVLVDAPCSGTGTWRRNPEGRWRLTPASLDGLVKQQDRLLDRAAGLVKPGGRLVYVTCSLLPVENEDRITAFQARHPGFVVLPIPDVWSRLLAAPCPDNNPFLQLHPYRDGVDGFFIAVLELSRSRENPLAKPAV